MKRLIWHIDTALSVLCAYIAEALMRGGTARW